MELQDILSVAIGTLIVVVVSHFAVFWVVRTLYPPQNQTVFVNAPMPPPVVTPTPPPPPPEMPPVFTPPTQVEQTGNVTLPTYNPNVLPDLPPEQRKGPPPPEETSKRGKPGLGTPLA